MLLVEEEAGLAVAVLPRAEQPALVGGARWLGARGKGLLVEEAAFGPASSLASTARVRNDRVRQGAGRRRASGSCRKGEGCALFLFDAKVDAVLFPAATQRPALACGARELGASG